MKKISLKQAQELLRLAGVSAVEVVADDAAADKDVVLEDVLVDIDTARSVVLKPQIEAELKPEIEKAVTGKLSGTYRAALKRTFKAAGVTEADLKDLNEEDALKVCLDKHNSTMSKDTETLRKELEAQGEAHTKAIELMTTQHAAELAEKESKYIDRDIKETLYGVVSKIPKISGDLNFQTEGFHNYLKTKYHIVYDAEGKIAKLRLLTDKETPALNEKKTKELTPEDVAPEYFEKIGTLVKDKRDVVPTDTLRQPRQPGDGAVTVDEPVLNPVQTVNNEMLNYLNQEG